MLIHPVNYFEVIDYKHGAINRIESYRTGHRSGKRKPMKTIYQSIDTILQRLHMSLAPILYLEVYGAIERKESKSTAILLV